MSKKEILLTVIIPTYERPDSLLDTLQSFNGFDSIPKEIIVVDQSSKYKTEICQVCKKFQNVRYIWSKIPSITISRNIGIANASNEIIVFSDDDVNIYSKTLQNVYDIMTDNNYALIGGLDINTNGKRSSFFSYLCGKKSLKKRGIGHVTKSVFGRYPDNVLHEVSTEWAMGYFFVVRKSLINQWKIKFDEKLRDYSYAEDLDFTFLYCKLANENNLKTILSPKVVVNHKVSKEYRTPSEKTIISLFVNRSYIANKYKNCFSKAFIKWTNFWIYIQFWKDKNCLKYHKKAKKIIARLEKNHFINFGD